MDASEYSSSKDQLIPGGFNPLLRDVSKYIEKSLECVIHSGQGQTNKNQDDLSMKKQTNAEANDLDKLFTILSLPPRFTTVRVNLLKTTLSKALVLIEEQLRSQHVGKNISLPVVYPHHVLPDLLVIESFGIQDVRPAAKKVIVGRMCGSAVLRGAEVFAPGVLGASADLHTGDSVAIFADLDDTCLRGCKMFSGRKMFLGNGIAVQSRKDLFKTSKPIGLAVSVKDKIFDAPSLGNCHSDLLFLQNLPSVLCSHILNPTKYAQVLDMCAAPGGKSTHIATLMYNTGQVIAIDRSQNKIDQIRSNAQKLGLTNVKVYKYDSTNLISTVDLTGETSREEKKEISLTYKSSELDTCKILSELSNKDQEYVSCSPPYKPSSFRWILLDAPCSALGQRPQIQTKTNIKELESFPVIQRKLLQNAVKLLKPGGKLVYSTCTIVLEENEKMVKWLLDKYTNIELIDTTPKLGKPGLLHSGLNKEECDKVQRFGPFPSTNVGLLNIDDDTIGFFVAAFRKVL
nr:tRNA (cytosine(72)-C(5))-methyltransferase NSUN6-like [Procambarus clarkii]XP_045599920.1 tRNA (cytosine(72)-C(5))-methyltransferase NSUN6-like [Procambarus clarkii]